MTSERFAARPSATYLTPPRNLKSAFCSTDVQIRSYYLYSAGKNELSVHVEREVEVAQGARIALQYGVDQRQPGLRDQIARHVLRVERAHSPIDRQFVD